MALLNHVFVEFPPRAAHTGRIKFLWLRQKLHKQECVCGGKVQLVCSIEIISPNVLELLWLRVANIDLTTIQAKLLRSRLDVTTTIFILTWSVESR